ncbi:class I lanthipeptide [Chitinophaga nivalis]|uniref:Class I lanthipeptide n=1 Tax=Chitinophaga nivalis TaxID=2991709 RepID=A0ABT3ILE1_9BACT|nr:class I lanthipeptide [Chitinophaga nivalis]MCW3465556.1 class I lanthipeptide [Chitinophaga nivalis]MCW3484753.1 class I lanthipeptide [Chitinophaga nivalis]
MKKKEIVLDKKLFLNKASIASLSNTQQRFLEGGLPETIDHRCFTWKTTCATIPPGQRICRMCD